MEPSGVQPSRAVCGAERCDGREPEEKGNQRTREEERRLGRERKGGGGGDKVLIPINTAARLF